jgi:hypothetical protein
VLQAYRRWLRGIVGVAPSWLAEQILSTGQHIDKAGVALWMGEN